MDVSKEMLAQYMIVVAVNAGMMNDDVFTKIKMYDKETFASILRRRIKDLEENASQSESSILDPEFCRSSARGLKDVLENLHHILSAS